MNMFSSTPVQIYLAGRWLFREQNIDTAIYSITCATKQGIDIIRVPRCKAIEHPEVCKSPHHTQY